MALEVSCYDGESKHIPVESSTTAHDFAMHVLQVKQNYNFLRVGYQARVFRFVFTAAMLGL